MSDILLHVVATAATSAALSIGLSDLWDLRGTGWRFRGALSSFNGNSFLR
jgi:hypothetical protein